MVTHYYLSEAKNLGKLTETNFLEYCNNFRKLTYPVLNGTSESMLKDADTYEKVFAAIIYSIHRSNICEILEYIDIGLTKTIQVEYITNILLDKMSKIDNLYISMIIGGVIELYKNYQKCNFIFYKKEFNDLSEIVSNLESSEKKEKGVISILKYVLNHRLLEPETYKNHTIFTAMMEILNYETIFNAKAFEYDYDKLFLELVSDLLNMVKRKSTV